MDVEVFEVRGSVVVELVGVPLELWVFDTGGAVWVASESGEELAVVSVAEA